ncbi:hypothetical protein [Kribbella italica]|uniref:Immunity repressor n=1 Tax=Kribbella italica TaxID=1540520 RepID=A0A7W9MRA0_9ACTN|nr:hypothetical protein [Kribbella italica]MBB5833401.1 hypothetical protein [Kribbella italica]
MVEQYREKYGIETVPSMWGNFRRRNGIEARLVRDDDLIPWEIKDEHRWRNAVTLLRAVARQRAGMELSERDAERLPGWLETRRETGTVVHYDPDTERGFFYVPRRPGIDNDLIREPESKTTPRRSRDKRDS